MLLCLLDLTSSALTLLNPNSYKEDNRYSLYMYMKAKFSEGQMKQNKLLGIKINCTAHAVPPRSMYEYSQLFDMVHTEFVD